MTIYSCILLIYSFIYLFIFHFVFVCALILMQFYDVWWDDVLLDLGIVVMCVMVSWRSGVIVCLCVLVYCATDV